MKLEKAAERPRHRRLESGEEEALLARAAPHVYALIVAALETGCRVGELLSLQWRDVRELDNVLLLPAKKTKDGEPRHGPMTSRLRATLDMRRLDPARRVIPSVLTTTCSGTDWASASSTICVESSPVDCERARHLGPRDPGLARAREHHDNPPYLATTRTTLQQARKKFEQHRSRCTRVAQTAEPATQPASDKSSQLQS